MADMNATERIIRWLNDIPTGVESNVAANGTNDQLPCATDEDSDWSTSSDRPPADKGYIETTAKLPATLSGIDRSSIRPHGAIISTNGPNSVFVNEFYDHFAMPPYPATSDDGIVHFIHCKNPFPRPVDEMTRREIYDIFIREMSKIQYAINGTHQPNNVKIKLFYKAGEDASRGWHRSYVCGGIKHCEYIDENLITCHDDYDRADPYIFRAVAPEDTATREKLKRQTEDWYRAFMIVWKENGCVFRGADGQNHEACSRESLSPSIFRRNNVWMIGCRKNSDFEPFHFAQALADYADTIDFAYLNALLRSGGPDRQDVCAFITSPSSRRPKCDRSHPQGPGYIKIKKCPARFDLYIPVKWEQFPFMLLVARGRHNHIPPPPSKPIREALDRRSSALASAWAQKQRADQGANDSSLPLNHLKPCDMPNLPQRPSSLNDNASVVYMRSRQTPLCAPPPPAPAPGGDPPAPLPSFPVKTQEEEEPSRQAGFNSWTPQPSQQRHPRQEVIDEIEQRKARIRQLEEEVQRLEKEQELRKLRETEAELAKKVATLRRKLGME